MNNSEFNFTDWVFKFLNELFIPILLSIIAATIFWLVFDYYPKAKKYKKIRPKVEFDLYQILCEFSFYFYTLQKTNSYRDIPNQQKINAGCLSKEQIYLLLQNKCLNDSFKYDINKDKLVSIGNDFEKITLKFIKRHQSILTFIDFLSVEEILLLQKIEYKLGTYAYNTNAQEIVGGKKYLPVNPNLAYMTENIFELYELFLSLRRLILRFKLIDKNINKYILPNFELMNATDSYYRGEYKKCLRAIKKKNRKENSWLLFKCLMKMGQKDKAYKILNELLGSSEIQLVSVRSSLSPFILEDLQVMKICKEKRSDAELNLCLKTIKEESLLKMQFEKQNLEIKNYYANK